VQGCTGGVGAGGCGGVRLGEGEWSLEWRCVAGGRAAFPLPAVG